MLLHKGFIGKLDYNDRTQKLIGEVVNAPDLLEFDGSSAKEIHKNFIKCVDDYLIINEESDEQQATSFVGQYSLSLSHDVLDKVMRKAKREGSSIETWLNRWVNSSLAKFLNK
jgi:predicted HicB family RNase H-like nuclease